MRPFLVSFDWTLPLLWRATWQAALLAALVFGLTTILGQRLAPAWRFALWGIVIARFLAPVLPASALSMYPVAMSVCSLGQDASDERTARPSVVGPPRGRSVTLSSVPARGTARATAPLGESAMEPERAPADPLWTPRRIAGLVWLAGLMLLAARTILAVFRLWRRSQRWDTTADPNLIALFDACRIAMGVRFSVRLRVTGEGLGPAVTGLVRPCVVIPSTIQTSASREDLEHVLLHELAHVRRRDVAIHWLITTACALHWFNPVVWYAARRMQVDRELACDAAVLRRLGRTRRSAYGETVLKLAARHTSPRPLPGMVGVFGARAQLHERIAMIADYTSPSRRWSLVAAGLLLALIVAGLTDATNPAAADEPPASKNAVAAHGESDDKATSPPPVSPAPRGPTAGIVRDAEDRPVAGVMVIAGRYSGENPVRRLATTGADGRFEVEPAKGAAPLNYFLAYKEGYAPACMMARLPRDGSQIGEIELKMGRPAPYVGIVEEREGRPVAGALVRVQQAIFDQPNGRRGDLIQFEQGVAGTPLERLFSATTDDQGKFRFPAMPEGARARLIVSSPGMGTYDSVSLGKRPARSGDMPWFLPGTDDAPARVVLEPPARLEGWVVTHLPDVGVSGLHVAVQGIHGYDGVWAEAKTDATGHFEIDDLGAGSVNVFLKDHPAAGPWTYRAVDSADLVPGKATEVKIELIAGVTVEGKVEDENSGKGISGIMVGHYGPMRPHSGAAIVSARTDPEGRFRFRLPPGRTKFYISGAVPGYPNPVSQRTSPDSVQEVNIPDKVRDYEVPTLMVRPLNSTEPDKAR